MTTHVALSVNKSFLRCLDVNNLMGRKQRGKRPCLRYYSNENICGPLLLSCDGTILPERHSSVGYYSNGLSSASVMSVSPILATSVRQLEADPKVIIFRRYRHRPVLFRMSSANFYPQSVLD